MELSPVSPLIKPRMADILRHGRGPSLNIGRRTVDGEMELDRAFMRAVQSQVGVDRVLPVIYRGKHLGWVKGEGPFSNKVYSRRRQSGDGMWCAFTSYDNIIAAYGVQKSWRAFFNKAHTTAYSAANNYYDLWATNGDPSPGAFGGAAHTANNKSDTTTGSLWHGGNVSTDTKNLLVGWVNSSGATPTLTLYDRCLTYEACAFNAAANQAMTNTNTLNRYEANGEGGCKVHISVQTVTGATAASLTQFQYTDQDGNATQSMPTSPTVTFIPSAAAPTGTLGARFIVPSTSGATLLWGPFLPLAAGDGGVRLVANFTTSAANTGTFTVVLNRPLAVLPVQTAGVTAVYDLVEQIAGMEKIHDGACISLYSYAAATTAGTYNGGVAVGWG